MKKTAKYIVVIRVKVDGVVKEKAIEVEVKHKENAIAKARALSQREDEAYANSVWDDAEVLDVRQ